MCLLIAALTVAGAVAVRAPELALAAGPAAQVTVSIAHSTVPVGGSTQVTATVTDPAGGPVANDEVDFSANGAQTFSRTTGTTDTYGQVTVKLTTSTTAGTYTLTATDPSPPGGVSGHATLTQAPGPPAHMSLTGPSPSSVLADNRSTATVVATLTDTYGNLVPGEPVAITSSDGGETVTPDPAHDNGDGTYTAQLTSSLSPGTVTVTATDTAASSVTATGTVTQTPWPVARVTVSAAPSRVTANGTALATATVTLTDANGRGRYGEGDALALTASDPDVRVGSLSDHGDGTYTAPLTAGKLAHAVTLSATDRPSGLHATTTLTQVAGPARRVRITLASPVLTADGMSSTKAFVRVLDASGNPVAGDRVLVTASGHTIAVGSVRDHHNGVYAVMLSSRTTAGRVTVTASDASVRPAVSSRVRLTVVAAPALATHVTLLWSFRYTPWWTYFRSFYLLLDHAPSGAALLIRCSGSRCPYAQRTTALPGSVRCASCRVSLSLGLTRPFVQHLLRPGTVVTVAVTRTGWSGKFYSFTVRSAQAPAVTISCLLPGATVPGASCS